MMTRDLGWYLQRLRAMPPGEIVYRATRVLRHPVEYARMRTGRYARVPQALEHWTGPTTFYFDAPLIETPVSAELRDRADAICEDRREVLGLGWVSLPAVPWHIEPSTGREWPRIAAARVLESSAPGFDPRLTWELNRGHEWVVLARTAAATGDSRYLARLENELSSWSEHDPLGVGINWASSMEAAIRIHSLAWVAGFLRGRPLGKVARMLHEHAVFVARNLSSYSSANNHLIVELSGIAVAGHVLGCTEWYELARGQLTRELARQVLPDGVNCEMATHYHELVLEALLLVAYLERARGARDAELEHVIARMTRFLDALRCGDGTVLGRGDGDDGKLIPFFAENYAGQLVMAARALLESRPTNGPARAVAGEEGAFWLTNGTARRTPPSASHSQVFPVAGQVVLRDEHVTAVLDAGPFGFGTLAAHAHCDALALDVALDGRRVLVDRGTYRYNGDPAARDRFRFTAAHNTLQFGTREQAESQGPFLWGRRPVVRLERCELDDEGDLVVASHDGFAPRIHRRMVLRYRCVLVVCDYLVGGGRGTSRFHVAPEFDVNLAGRSVQICDPRTGEAISWLRSSVPTVRLVDFEHSDRYACLRIARTIECELDFDNAGPLIVMIGTGNHASLHDGLAGLVKFTARRFDSELVAQITALYEGGT